MTKTQKITYYISLTLISLLFAFSGFSKLFASQQVIDSFAVAHLPVWFMYFIGVCEILGAIGLWVRKFAAAAGYCLLVILVGAVVVTAAFVSVPMAAFPLIVGILLCVVIKLGKKKWTMMAMTGSTTTPAPTV